MRYALCAIWLSPCSPSLYGFSEGVDLPSYRRLVGPVIDHLHLDAEAREVRRQHEPCRASSHDAYLAFHGSLGHAPEHGEAVHALHILHVAVGRPVVHLLLHDFW